MITPKIGLVLSGGGARGAYEAGVVKYMAQKSLEPDAYAGASIGTFNGALLASSPNIKVGSERLLNIWQNITKEKIVNINNDYVLWILLFALGRITGTGNIALGFLSQDILEKIENRGVLDVEALIHILEQEIDFDTFQKGKPLWISVYESKGVFFDIFSLSLASLGLKNSKASQFIQLQSLERTEQIKAIMASAALPFIFPKQTVNEKNYRDGGMGGWMEQQGNTPIQPLIDIGCNLCIVIHLSNGSLWNRHNFTNTAIIEIRPEKPIHPEGVLKSLLNFEPKRIQQWIEQGYEDAKRCLDTIYKTLDDVQKRENARETVYSNLNKLKKDDLDQRIDLLD